jgi:predicted transcriptional regulator
LALSRMEKYLAIIRVLDNRNLITQKQIMEEANLELKSPKECLDFLVQMDLVIERNLGSKKVYAITEKGERVFNYFRLNDESPIFGRSNITKID